MELYFVILLIVLMALALGWGFPVAYALPGAAVLTIAIASLCGWVFAGNVDAYFAQGGPGDWLSAGVTNFRGVYWEVERDTLIAIPLFIFMGIMLQRSKLAEDLLVTMAQMFGPVPGGLGISVVFVGALLAATTGIVGATVVAMGLISLPAMNRSNYSHSVATGTIAASGTLGQIIPPSIVLIILADQLSSAVDQANTARKVLFKETTHQLMMPSSFGISSTSAGEMFLGAVVPGLVLVGLYVAYLLFIAVVRPSAVPTVRYEGKFDLQFLKKVLISLVPPLTLIFLVLGSIILGIATVNQAGAVGAAGATFMAGYRLYEGRKHAFTPAIIGVGSVVVVFILLANFTMNVKDIQSTHDAIGIFLGVLAVIALVGSLVWSGWRTYVVDNTLRDVMVETAKTCALVFIILMGAAMLTASFRAFGGEELVKTFLRGMPGGFWAQFVIVMAVIFILGFFIDFIEISVVVVPIVAPILLMDPGANVTAVWLGVMIGLNIQTSFLTPPFGFALFYLRGVAPAAIRTISIYKGVIPFILLQVAALFIVGTNPQLVNYLPMRLSLLSDTAPPPRNPALQSCIEDYVFKEYASQESRIKSAIQAARGLDLSSLPTEQRKDLEASFDKAAAVFTMVDKIHQTAKVRDEYAKGYKDLHIRVRSIQDDIRRNEKKIKDMQLELSRLPDDKKYESRRQHLQSRIKQLQSEIKPLEAQIPDDWAPKHKQFAALNQAEHNARNLYRRDVDQAYEPVQNLIKTLEAADSFAALQAGYDGVKQALAGGNAAEALAKAEPLVKKVREQPDTYKMSQPLGDVVRALKLDTPDMKRANEQFAKAETAYAAEKAWRTQAAASLLPGLKSYSKAIGDTIGLRLQPRLPHDVALSVAACEAVPPDLSLSF